ncbi:bile acid:sodium symporter family protein [Sphingomonas sp.]|uniref:bile acid:sodium symporter family protein n=1 Tax=Sphingomonas sp. TaxID=28214 RepID=UPI002DD661EC|nr:bile acid:sodium symporter family protein [Sphingomonas sp.]
MMKRVASLVPDPFVAAILATVVLATLLPVHGGGARVVGLVSSAMVTMLFFVHGAKLSRSAAFAGLRHWRLHLAILGATFLLFPLLTLALTALLPKTLLAKPLIIGLLYLSVLPSTVQSAIAFVSLARGNVAAAIASASASQMLGVLVTPLLVGFTIGRSAHADGTAAGAIVLQILLPFILGNLLEPWIGGFIRRHKTAGTLLDRGTIMLAVYSAFSAAVIGGLWRRVDEGALMVVLAICLLLLGLMLLTTALLGRAMGLARPDAIALQFCGTKKSLVQGVPMARLIFPGPDLGLILLPLMIFHQVQLMACAGLARRYAARGDRDVHG